MAGNKIERVELTGVVMLGFGALLVIVWLVLRFIVTLPNKGQVAVGEIIAFILSGALLLVLGVYLCVYRAKYELEIARLIRTASADLVRSIDGLRQVLAKEQSAPKPGPTQEENVESLRSIRDASASLFRSIDDLRQILASQSQQGNPGRVPTNGHWGEGS